MKNFIIGIFVLLMAFSAIGCEKKEEGALAEHQRIIGEIIGGEHRLRKMSERTNMESKTSGSFFILLGDFRSSTETKVHVKFAWEMNDGTYAISSLPLEKIRIKIDEKAKTPTVQFVWNLGCFFGCRNYRDLQYMMDHAVDYAVVTARDLDWPAQVDLPLNQTRISAQ